MNLTVDDFEQAGFARPVAADERYAFTRIDAEVHRLEQRQMSKGERHALQRDERHPAIILTADWRVPNADSTIDECRWRLSSAD